MKIIYSIILIATFAFSNWAQSEPNTQKGSVLPSPDDLLMNNVAKNNYLTPLLKFRSFELNYNNRRDFLLMMSYMNSFVGDYKSAYSYYDRLYGKPAAASEDLKSSPLDTYQPRDAVDVIGSVADKQQVIMINEEHDTPMHRAFTTRLLAPLYSKGFRYFAAETLKEYDRKLNERKYPVNGVIDEISGIKLYGTGFYTADPVYADLVRTAIKLGFKVVSYEPVFERCQPTTEDPQLCQNRRERKQAQNLYDRILRDDPKAKMLIHVGRGHNSEKKGSDGWIPMGVYFKEITGIDPFTINQMSMSERSAPTFEPPLYRYAALKWMFKEPTVFLSKEGNYWKSASNDLQIFHPRTQYEKGRATWLKIGGLRKIFPLDLTELSRDRNLTISESKPILVQAFLADESADTVPIDQVIVTDLKNPPVLLLPKGHFRIRTLDDSGKVINERKITT